MERRNLPNGTAVLVLGILSIITCCCYGFIGLILGIMQAKVSIIMGSTSDMPVMQEAAKILDQFQNLHGLLKKDLTPVISNKAAPEGEIFLS